MWESIKHIIPVVISLVALLTGGLAGAVATMIFNYYRRDKVWLGTYVKRRTIIEPKHPNVSIHYNDQQVNRLDLQEIVLKNIGNKVIENISIKIETTGEVVDRKLEAPEGSTFSLEPELDNSKMLILNCDYINLKDTITVQITEADSDNVDAKVIARAKNLIVKQLEVPNQEFEVIKLVAALVPGILAIFAIIAVIIFTISTFNLKSEADKLKSETDFLQRQIQNRNSQQQIPQKTGE